MGEELAASWDYARKTRGKLVSPASSLVALSENSPGRECDVVSALDVFFSVPSLSRPVLYRYPLLLGASRHAICFRVQGESFHLVEYVISGKKIECWDPMVDLVTEH